MTDASKGGSESTWARVTRRKVVQWGMVYVAGAWGFLQGLEYLSGTYDWPRQLQQLVTLALLIGLPIVLVLAWYHGDRGQQRITTPELAILTLLLLLGGGVFWWVGRLPVAPSASEDASAPVAQPAANAKPAGTSIAVLPFVNMSNDPTNEYFSDGISEEILNTLARVEGLQVAARTAALQFKGRGADIAEIGRKLKVGAVLEGSVRRAGDSVRISVQLVDTTNGYRVWSQTFDRNAADVFAVQTEIAGEVADALQLAVASDGARPAAVRLRKLPTKDPRAYELFLQGRYLWRQRNGPAITRAVGLLEEAVRLDPRFAEAHAALASAYGVLQNYASVDAATTRARALAAADRALALDNSLAEAIAVQAGVLEETQQWQAAERHYLRAIELAPDEPTPHHWLALMYLSAGYRQEFSTEIARAYALDPTNASIAGMMTIERHFAGDTAGAVQQAELAASMGGVFALVAMLPEVLYEAGQPAAALEATRRGFAQIGLDPGLADTVHAATLDPARRSAAREAILSAPRQFYSANIRIDSLLRIGEFEFAVHEALEAPDASPSDLLYGAWSKSQAGLRATPEFRRFVREVGLVEYWRERGWPDLCHPRGEDFDCT